MGPDAGQQLGAASGCTTGPDADAAAGPDTDAASGCSTMRNFIADVPQQQHNKKIQNCRKIRKTVTVSATEQLSTHLAMACVDLRLGQACLIAMKHVNR